MARYLGTGAVGVFFDIRATVVCVYEILPVDPDAKRVLGARVDDTAIRSLTTLCTISNQNLILVANCIRVMRLSSLDVFFMQSCEARVLGLLFGNVRLVSDKIVRDDLFSVRFGPPILASV